MSRNRAWRRAQRERAVKHAEPIVRRLFPMGDRDIKRVLRWADNLKKCSCSMCNSGDPHDRAMMLRAPRIEDWA